MFSFERLAFSAQEEHRSMTLTDCKGEGEREQHEFQEESGNGRIIHSLQGL